MNFNSKKGIMGVLLVLSILCSGAISLVTYQTMPRIQRNEETRRLGIVLDVLQIKYDPKNIDDIVSTYKNRVTESEQNGIKLFKEKESGATALSLSGSGFQSIINVIVALKGDTISGFKVVSQNETPGLGARMSEKAFQSSFIGKKVSGGITWVKTGKAGPGEFDAITGATESSKALTRILNRGFSLFFGDTAAPAIPKGMEVKIEMSVLNMFGGNYSLQDSAAIRKNFGETVAETEVKGIKTYKDKKSGATALLVSGSGYQSSIIGLVGLKDDTISTFKIVSQNETPGLGTRITEDAFLKQFIGKKVSGGIKMVKTGKAGPTEFDAITRSTVSSEAVERMLNKGFAAHYNIQLQQVAEATGEAAPKAEAPAAQEPATQTGGNAPLSAEMRRLTAVLDVFGISYSPQDSLAVTKIYQERITEGNEKGLRVFRDKVSGARALCLTGKGFQDTITLAVTLKGNTIGRLRVVSQNETQGFGTRIIEDAFQNQFAGKNIGHGITLVKTGKAGPSEFDALTGATVTSEAVARILNEGFGKYLGIKVEPSAVKAEEPAPKTEEAAKTQPAAPAKTEEGAPSASQAPAQSEAGAAKTHDGKLMTAVLDVFGISYAAQDNDAISKTFGTRITESEEKGLTVFRDKESGSVALVLSGKGYADVITIVVALKGDTVSGFKVASSNETQGFGERIKEDSFQKQFIGKKVSQGITMVKTGKAGPAEFDALTGATITSEAVAKMLDNGFKTHFGAVK
jgi:Na+-translocating ferredoxin:NAD+ oxidoreductase subunit G